MLCAVRKWLGELKAEAPWYFWAYVALTPLGLLMTSQESMFICAVAALLIYIFLLKAFGLLRSPSVYVLAITAYCMMDGYIIDYFLGKQLYSYVVHMNIPFNHQKISYITIVSICSSGLASVIYFIYKKSLTYIIKVFITVFFMLVASIYGILIVLLPFLAR